MSGYYPPYDATCVSSLIASGAHIVGQTKMDEFGMGYALFMLHIRPVDTDISDPRRHTFQRGISQSITLVRPMNRDLQVAVPEDRPQQ